MNIGDRVNTPAGPGSVVGWYDKGTRQRISVRLDGLDGAGQPRIETFDAGEVATA